MGLNWNNINWTSNKTLMIRRIKNDILKPERYGMGEGQWNLTDIVFQPIGLGIPFFKAIAGEAHDNEQQYGMQLRDPDGNEFFKFRLKVLSRQACTYDAKGKPIDHTNMDPNEPPQPGDVIEWKGGHRAPERGPHRTTGEIKMWQRMGEREHEYVKHVVDRDLCISAPIMFALPMLKKHGKRVVYPEFRGKGSGRKIANWRFQEVDRDYRAERPKKTKPNKSKVPTTPPESESQSQTTEINDGNFKTD